MLYHHPTSPVTCTLELLPYGQQTKWENSSLHISVQPFEKENIPAKIIFGENPLWAVYMPQLKWFHPKNFTDTILQNYPKPKISISLLPGMAIAYHPI